MRIEYQEAADPVRRCRHYFIIAAVYVIGFLLITPLGKFNPGVPHPRSFSLMTIDRWDDTAYYMIAKSIIVDGDLDYSNEKLADLAFYNLNSLGNTTQGTSVPIGPSILWAPFIVFAHILTVLINAFSPEMLAANGYSRIYLLLSCVGSSIYAFISLLISYKILTKFFSPNTSLLSVLTVFIGNSLIYNTYIRMLMSHSSEVFAIALFVLFFLRVVNRGEILDYLLFGIASGFIVIVRYDNAIFLIMPTAHVLYHTCSSIRAGHLQDINLVWRRYSISALFSMVVILPQFIHYYIQSGVIIPTILSSHLSSTFNTIVGIKSLLFSETRNILWGQPIVIIGAIGSFLFIKQNRFLGITFSLIILFGILWLFWRPHVYWWGMDFGIRHLIKLSLPLAFGYAALITSVNIRRKAIVFCALSFMIIIWEYLKLIQVPSITPVLKDGFLTACAIKIPGLITDHPLTILTGTECSYLRVLTTYGLKLDSFNMLDCFYLIVFPLSFLALCSLLVLLFVYLDIGYFSRRSRLISVMVVVIFFLALSMGGLVYPKKPPAKIYNDFKRAAVLAYDAGKYELSLSYINKALSIDPDGDALIKSLMTFINTDYFDFGTANARKALKMGWSIDEGNIFDPECPTFVWAIGTEALVEVEIKPNETFNTLIFKGMPYPRDQIITLLLNGKRLGQIKASPGWNEYRIPVKSMHLLPGGNQLVFKFKHAKSPFETGSKDKRNLAMALDWLRFEDGVEVDKGSGQ